MTTMSRRSFVGSAATGVAAFGTWVNSVNAEGQLVYTTSDWKLAEFNQLVRSGAHVKQLFDILQISEGRALNSMKNSLNGLHCGFGIPNERIKIVAALHGPANMLNYDDFIWNKYKIGSWLKVMDPSTNQPALKNPYFASKAGSNSSYASDDPNSRDSLYQDTSIQALQRRGVQLLSCHTATEEQARGLIAQQNLTQKPEEVVQEMLAHALPNVLVVPSMVAAIALLQTEGRYCYTTA
jgi:hypothetical protein